MLESSLSIVVTYDPQRGGPAVLGRHAIADAGLYSVCLAIQNLWLAATAEELGVGWVSFYREPFLRGLLGIPAGIRPVAWLCLGRSPGYRRCPTWSGTDGAAAGRCIWSDTTTGGAPAPRPAARSCPDHRRSTLPGANPRAISRCLLMRRPCNRDRHHDVARRLHAFMIGYADLAPLCVKRRRCRGVLGWWSAGPGSDFSEVSTVGFGSAALDCRVAPACPPGPVREPFGVGDHLPVDDVGQPSFQARMASIGVLPAASLRR